MKSPLVSREAYDVVTDALAIERARVDELTKLVATMRSQGFTAAKPATVHEPKDVETDGLRAAEQRVVQRRDDVVFIQRAAADIQRRVPGISEAQAIAEATKLRRQITDQEDLPV